MNTSNIDARSENLVDGEVLTGTILRPYIEQDKLRGAILYFEGKKETALLHLKQIRGDEPEKRLSELRMGEQLEVKILVHGPAHARKVWASEVALLEERTLIDELLAAVESKTIFSGKVSNVSKFGVFVDLSEGAAEGKRGLIHNSNLYQKGTSLGQVGHSLTPNSDISLQVLGVKVDSAGTLRIDLALAEQSA